MRLTIPYTVPTYMYIIPFTSNGCLTVSVAGGLRELVDPVANPKGGGVRYLRETNLSVIC